MVQESVELENLGNKESLKDKEVKGFGGQESPEEHTNFIFRISFDWANKFVWFCFRNVLELKHIWNLASYDRADYLSAKIGKTWAVEMTKPNPSYVKAAMRAFGFYFISSWIFYAIYAASQFVGPELLTRMVKFVVLSRTPNLPADMQEDPNMGYYYALALFGSAMIGSFCLYQSNMISARSGDYLRSIIVCDVYKKALKLSNSSRSKTSPGEIVNLMSNDAQRMVEVFTLVNNGVFAIPQIVVALVLLDRAIGWRSTLAGFGLMVIAIPINGIAAKKLTEIRRFMIQSTDKRIKTTNEILQSIKIIKLYAWEDSFAQRVTEKRVLEVKQLFRFARYRSMLIIIVAALPTAVSVLVFSSYYGYYKSLDAGKIFASLAYLNILRLPLGFLPIIIALVVQLKVAANRVTGFLLLPEIKPPKYSDNYETKAPGVYMKDATFTWNIEKKEETFGLKNINFECTGNNLTMVVGSVGSGKSSLVQSILGEMDQLEGESEYKGRIAYVPQQAWIINSSLRDNILYGSPFDEEKYLQVLQVCALERDLELFPQGDLVEIGERGVNLSGGQKQRVSIARAVYNDADVYILDDPLSAVDAHVGKHIFHKCISGILKNKTVILVANQLNYVPFASQVVVMKDGEIVERGNYESLMNDKKEFCQMLLDYGIEEHVVEKEDVVIEEKTKAKEKPKLENKDGKLIQQEERETGSVGLNIYMKYFAAGGATFFAFCLCLFLVDTGARTFTDWWLSHWSNETQYGDGSSNLTNEQYLYIYIGIGLASVIISGCRNVLYFDFTVRCSKVLHDQLFSSLLKAPMWFFDTTPLGRIINRFTRDLDGVDNLIAAALSQYLVFFTTVIATLIIIAIITPFLLVPLAPIIVIFLILQYFYRFTSRELQRLESISRSPIFAHFSETLNGLTTIRAYKTQDINILTNQKNLDNNNRCYLTLQAMNQWLGVRLDFLGNLIIFFACVFITRDKSTIPIANVGLSLSYALSITGNLNRATLQAADTETKMNSVERIVHYIKGPVEAPQITQHRPDPQWPQQGSIIFENLVLRYREGLDPVLKGISLEIKPKEKIGIVGRTGAGKSTIVLALFRLVEASEGKILIDGEDISKFGLKDLRRNLSIIPQDPVLFSGTLRDNLDPFKEVPDAEIWDILEQIQLNQVVTTNGGLDCVVQENGDNWSVGQRQLICLGRALLRKPKILVLDEATASVDQNTDSLIQKTIREKFTQCTILTIAHRLNTIMDSDRILVLDAGKVSEFDRPHTLLQNPNGLLTWLVDETGPQNAVFLRKLAQNKENGISSTDLRLTPPDSPVFSKPSLIIEEQLKTLDDDNNNNTTNPNNNSNNNNNQNINDINNLDSNNNTTTSDTFTTNNTTDTTTDTTDTTTTTNTTTSTTPTNTTSENSTSYPNSPNSD